MEFPFPINKLAVGPDFLGRRKEIEALVSNILSGRHTLISDAERTGKHSLVRNAMDVLERKGYKYTPVHVDFFRSRSEEALLKCYAEAVLQAFTYTEDERRRFCDKYFKDISLSDDRPLTAAQKKIILSVPEVIGRNEGAGMIVWLDEFQNILNFDDPDSTLKLLEQVMLTHENVTYIIMGSKVNAMKYIFEQRGWFFNFLDRMVLPRISEEDMSNHIVRVFLKVGRIITRQHTRRICDYAQGNPWIVWQITNICFNLTRGYVTDSVVSEAVNTLLMSHRTEFHDTIDSLSNYQLRLLKAVFDGEISLNSQSVIDRYNLNSSANVHRLKEALLKKEIITFDGEYRPAIIDPFFHLWLTEDYFSSDKR